MPLSNKRALPSFLNLLFAGFALLFVYSFLALSKVLFNVELLRVTFVFTVLESVMFFFQVVYFWFRPDDKNRLWFLILLMLFICFNLIAGNLPNPAVPVPIVFQYIVSHGVGFALGMYLPFYLYKACDLTYLRTHAYYGVFYYLLIPYVVFFVGVYPFVQDIVLIKRIGLIIPFIYSIKMYYAITKSVVEKWKISKNEGSVFDIVCIYLAATLWHSLIVVNVFAWDKIYSVLGTNLGLIVMAIMFIRKTVHQSRLEHQELISLNNDLIEKVNQRTQELQELYISQTNNFINLVHETKTPLTLVGNYLDEYIAENGQDKKIRVIKNGISKLTKDITSIFEIERFIRGFSNFNNSRVINFSEVLEQSLELFQYYSVKKNIIWIKEIQNDVLVKADPVAVNRIINNLIENSIKFSPVNSTIEITLTATIDHLKFIVSDTGTGILPEYHEKVFEPYFQIGQHKGNSQGMGLGLPLVKQVVSSLGGEIRLTSDPAVRPGTVVTIALPVEASLKLSEVNHKYEPVIYESIYEELPVYKYNDKLSSILIVEDNISLVKYLMNKFNTRYNVFFALNGDEGLNQLEVLPAVPDIIITDIMMDGLDGFTFVERLSKSNQYNHIPVIFLSAKSTFEDKIQGLQLGAIDFIQKPFSYEELSLKVESILENIASQHKAILSLSIASIKSHRPAMADVIVDESLFESNLIRYNFTKSEIAIIRLIRVGHSTEEIANKLFNSVRTISTHMGTIYKKVGVSGRVAMLNKLERQA